MRNLAEIQTQLITNTNKIDKLSNQLQSLIDVLSVDYEENDGKFTASSNSIAGTFWILTDLAEKLVTAHKNQWEKVRELMLESQAMTERLNLYKLAEMEAQRLQENKGACDAE